MDWFESVEPWTWVSRWHYWAPMISNFIGAVGVGSGTWWWVVGWKQRQLDDKIWKALWYFDPTGRPSTGSGKAVVQTAVLAEHLETPFDEVEASLYRLYSKGWVGRDSGSMGDYRATWCALSR